MIKNTLAKNPMNPNADAYLSKVREPLFSSPDSLSYA